MTVKVIKDGRNWRPYRFPPRCSAPVQTDWSGDPSALQRAISDGFQQGIEKGYQEGLLQGQEAGQREGFETGRQEGLRQGREEGRQQGRQAFEAASQPLDRITAELNRFLAEFERNRRQDLLELVKKVSKQVIRCELTLNPTQLLTLAEEALAAMPGEQGDVHIHLNPEECTRIKDLAPERAAAWRLVPDERLALGECRVVTAQAEADIGCQQRLDSCMDTLSEHLNVAEA
ncbi:flagellar assembly protein FliH [Pseudomonas indica]|uniref:Flagellar assembly protein FliH n=1 Tax=Pseudomonas indica TaxID=137658 RepID=A0A1G9H443_9PSED|nr:flagellar assembly protein FliH [Pseudomonas indica]MBU3057593.1 flagellar assembly protein H [Pseudomonas indica]SDL07660.1 flagellar assembly protein FliH [Pseudomonas indica]